eukprot:TRINITY_DN47849_c0_g1_i1.p1 TRINITY_DN47849_c0_g1~~TRINITY_DN47849_c0_g1_i1.p1  ORF type:complete len:402 (-),score=81.68 TRINITY_DN47849_c0_g1_i1:69-1274(-)
MPSIATLLGGLIAPNLAPFLLLRCFRNAPPGDYLLAVSFLCAPLVLMGMFATEFLRTLGLMVKPDVEDHYRWGVDLRGQICVVTGCNTGIGKRTAASMASLGATVVMACRSKERAEQAKLEIEAELMAFAKEGRLEVEELDLGDLKSVDAFITRFSKKYGDCNVLVNNAGLNTGGTTVDQYETCFQVNYLGHFYLTLRLLPILQATAKKTGVDSRIVCLSSVMHHFADPDVHRGLVAVKRSGGAAASSTYKESKLYMLLLASELREKKLEGIHAIAVNPGAVRSDIWRSTPKWVMPAYDALMRFMFLSTQQGCATSVAAAAAPESLVPKDALYLTPYRPWLGLSLPFDLLGPFAGGANVATPHMPRNERLEAAKLWSSSLSLIEAVVGKGALRDIPEGLRK